MRPLRIPAVLLVPLALALAACGGEPPSRAGGPTNTDPRPSAAGASPAAPAAKPLPTKAQTATPELPEGVALLRAVRAARHPGYDRLVFEFEGSAPQIDVRYVDQVVEDPTGDPVPLRGEEFLSVVFHGATLDTTPQVLDSRQARRYTGPQRLAPGYPVLKEVAVAGDFESVLSFGVGLEYRSEPQVRRLTAPVRLVIDFPHRTPPTHS
ncbi:AMIN-like domain-containing (lipo)protein [Carbonactinospora thermoautotrophica]|uniref:AMIN-like domain-containing (lipo)protein n=2 Tax=Carbonactinospora thermoautotrophica TaxID=1469144 RepID=UPI000833054E|nr:hypothetical protein [Carbonactinospora thermoautotrophica]